MTILLSLFGQAAIAPDKEKNFLMPEQPETASEGAIHEIVSQNESKASLPCAPETPQNPPCATLRTKDEPKATPEENGPENGDKAAVARWWRPWPMPGTGELPAVSIRRGHVRHVYEDGTTRFVGIAAAPMIPNGPLAQRMRAAPYPDPAPKGVHSVDSLHRLAAIDTNIDALLGWGLVPHLQDGELVIDGMDALDAESRAGLERWLAHAGPNGEPRQERVIRALKTGRRCAA